MAKKNDTFPALLNVRSGTLRRLTDQNRFLAQQPHMREVEATTGENGRLVEASEENTTTAIAGSNDLQRIGEQLLNVQLQRQQLLTAALKLPNGEEYLENLGVYDGKEDRQAIDTDSLKVQNRGAMVREAHRPTIGMEDVSDQLAAEQEEKEKSKPKSKRGSSKKTDDDSNSGSDDEIDL